MAENQKNGSLMFWHLIIMTVALLGSGMTLFAPNAGDLTVMTVICAVTAVLTAAFGFCYFMFRYKKNGALFYKLFMAAFTVTQGLRIAAGQQHIALTLLMLAALIVTVVLATAKDLGNTKTKVCAAVLMVLTFAAAVFTYLLADENARLTYLASTTAVLSCTAALMVVGKYSDKDERGTK